MVSGRERSSSCSPLSHTSQLTCHIGEDLLIAKTSSGPRAVNFQALQNPPVDTTGCDSGRHTVSKSSLPDHEWMLCATWDHA